MTKTKKYYLVFVGYALIMMLVWVFEFLFVDHLTPFKLVLPLIFILPVYSVIIYRIGREKTAEKQ